MQTFQSWTTGRAAMWATVAIGTGASTQLVAAATGKVAIPRYMCGMTSAAASIRIGYGTALATSAWGAFQTQGGVPFNLFNFSKTDTSNANLDLTLNVGAGAGTTWVTVAFEFVKTTGTTS